MTAQGGVMNDTEWLTSLIAIAIFVYCVRY